ncbi:unnamed protein product [Camellia sinensis]
MFFGLLSVSEKGWIQSIYRLFQNDKFRGFSLVWFPPPPHWFILTLTTRPTRRSVAHVPRRVSGSTFDGSTLSVGHDF